MKNRHVSVLLNETISNLEPIEDGTYIDATLGAGGHSLELLKRLKTGILYVFDLDLVACQKFKELLIHDFKFRLTSKNLLTDGSRQVSILNANFSEINQYVKTNVQGIIADLGFATNQLDSIAGLSFQNNEELDMRIDKSRNVKASDLLNGLYTKELESMFIKFADVTFAKQLAKAIVNERKKEPITSTLQLNKIIQKIVPFNLRKGNNKHPEAKVYQALRIAVNDELNSLQNLLRNGFEILGSGGKFAVISFHSGEDRLVKNYFRDLVLANNAKFIAKLVRPSEKEISENNNSRSAKLRVIEKI